MSNIIDSEAGSELFSSYEAELRLVSADLSQKLEQIPEQTGEPRKATTRAAERLIEEAVELLEQMRIEKQNIPAPSKSAINARFRNHSTDIDNLKRRLATLSSDRSALFGSRYTDDPDRGGADAQLEQRQQLLSGTERLGRSSDRLRDTQRIALETEDIGRNTLADLGRQREVIEHTQGVLIQSEGYTDRATRTLKGMARRMATNRIITIAIITVLVILIIAVVVSKFR
jgi:vesicle transport through interaction with t-SNAREs protein 1